MVADDSTFNAIRSYNPRSNSPIVHRNLISAILPRELRTEWKKESGMDVNGSLRSRTAQPTRQLKIDRSFHKRVERPALDKQTQFFKMFRSDVYEYPMDQEALIYDPTSQALHHLNETAYFVWRHYESQSPKDLAQELTRTYNVDIETATDHVAEAINMFRINGLFAVEPLDESYE